jgi:hypothetical protein
MTGSGSRGTQPTTRYGDGPPFRAARRERLLDRIIPVTNDLRGYRIPSARADVLAGVTVAALAIPAVLGDRGGRLGDRHVPACLFREHGVRRPPGCVDCDLRRDHVRSRRGRLLDRPHASCRRRRGAAPTQIDAQGSPCLTDRHSATRRPLVRRSGMPSGPGCASH